MRPPKVRKYLLLFLSQPKNLINHFEMHGMNIVCIVWPTAIHKFHKKRYWIQNGRCFGCAFKFINFRFESSKYLFPFILCGQRFIFFFVFAQRFDLDGNGFFLYSFFFTRKYCIILQKVFEITCLNRINEMKCNAIEI